MNKNNKRKFKYDILQGIPYFFILVFFVLIPILLVIFYSFEKNPDSGVFQLEFSLNNYRKFFGNLAYLRVMGESILFAIITTVICLLIGYPLAYFISKQKPKLQSILILLTTAPMWLNMLIRTLALKQVILIIDRNNIIIGSWIAIIIGMVYIFLPFMVVPIYAVVSKIDKTLYEASSDLGASNFKTFIKVTIPLSTAGINSGILLVLLPAATTLIIPSYLGNRKFLIANIIEAYAKAGSNAGVASSITIVLSLLMIGLVMLTKIPLLKDKNKGGLLDANK